MIENPFADDSVWELGPITELTSVYQAFVQHSIIDYNELSKITPVLSPEEIDAFVADASVY